MKVGCSGLPITLRCASWNVLADCYAPPSSPLFSWEERREVIRDSFRKLTPPVDLLMLQEADHNADFYEPMLTAQGYESLYLQRPGRKDGLLVGYRPDKMRLIKSEEVNFDDLAVTVRKGRPPKRDPFFERANVGLICRFQSTIDPAVQFIVSNCHLYWNPARPEVKLAQARYLLQKIRNANEEDNLPIICGGDFNALPHSDVYDLITDASTQQQIEAAASFPRQEPKFLVDINLSKLARWMRVLGIDCLIESKESQVLRSGKKGDFSMLFAQARSQNRVILTSSRQMRERASCPQSMLLNTSSLESELTRICDEFGIEIREARFLTVCGKCGGQIESVSIDDARLSGKFLPADRPIFCCSSCLQPYWWNEKENSSPARAMRVAERLHKLIRGDDTWRGDGSAVFKGNASKLSGELTGGEAWEREKSLVERFALRNQTIWAEQSEMKIRRDISTSSSPMFLTGLSSAVSLHRGEEAPFTNWNGDFQGTLDYIFLSRGFTVQAASVEPTFIEAEHNSTESSVVDLSVHGPLPNRMWPSDHLCVACTVTFPES